MNCRNEMKMKKWSSQWMQFMQLRKEAWKKKFRTSTGSNHVEFLNFFSDFFTQLHKLHSLRRSFLHFHFISAVHIWFVSYIINNNNNLIIIIKIASQHAGTNTTSSRSLTWTQNVDCVAISTRPLTTWSLAALNWLKLNTSTATTRQLHTCTGRSAKSLALRWRNDGMSMYPGLSPRMTESLFCGTCPSTLTWPKRF